MLSPISLAVVSVVVKLFCRASFSIPAYVAPYNRESIKQSVICMRNSNCEVRLNSGRGEEHERGKGAIYGSSGSIMVISDTSM